MKANEEFELILQGGSCFLPTGEAKCDIGIKNGIITSFSPRLALAKQIVNCHGLTIFPGVIDGQVHFREPGLVYKEDLESGSKAALLGGVTGFLEMPNTKPATSTKKLILEKISLASNRCYSNFGFFIGGTAQNLEELIACENTPGCVGIKIFLGSSTGDLLLYDEKILEQIFRSTKLPIAFHSENELRLKERESIRDSATHARMHPEWRDVETALSSTKMILNLAQKCQRKIHILHISTAEEMELLKHYPDIATVEVLPQHLTLSAPDCYDRFGTYAQMNPPIRTKIHQDGLWKGINEGTVDVIGSDHAPHTMAEKEKGYPHSPSGIPGVQTMFPLMLHHALEGKISLLHLTKLMSENTAAIYGLRQKGRIELGRDADFTIVDLKSSNTVKLAAMASKCGHTIYDGLKLKGKLVKVIMNGEIALEEGMIVNGPKGKIINKPQPV